MRNIYSGRVRLIAGEQYEVSSLMLVDWTDGDGFDAEGYRLSDFFEADGTYLGPDQHGIEPVAVYRDLDR